MSRTLNILVVDDDVPLLETFQAALSSARWRILAADSSSMAEQQLAQHRISALLIDALPGYIGVVSKFRTQSPSSPIVVLTGGITPEQECDVRSAGANLVLYKPVGVSALKGNLQDLLVAASPENIAHPEHDSAVQQVIDLERRLIEASVAGDVGTVSHILSDDYVFAMGAAQGESKLDRLRLVETGRLSYESVELCESTPHHYGDVCVLNSLYHVIGRRESQDISGYYRSVRIYRMRSGRWTAVAGQFIRQPAELLSAKYLRRIS